MKILMPYPPSANRYLRHTARGTYRTSEANKYRASVATRARIAGACMIYNGVQLIATLHPKLTASGKASKTCIAGFRGLTDRLCQHIDSAPLLRMEKLFAAGAPLTIDLIDDALRMLRMVEDELIKHTVYAVQDAVLVEQIMIELEAIAEDRKAA